MRDFISIEIKIFLIVQRSTVELKLFKIFTILVARDFNSLIPD